MEFSSEQIQLNNKSNDSRSIAHTLNGRYLDKIGGNIDETYFDVELHDDMIEQNKEMCIRKIPNFVISINLITLNINIGGIDVKAMIDTGANCCVFYKSAVDKCKLGYLIDKNSNHEVNAAQGIVTTYGKIWYLDITIQNYSVPCSFDVIDNPTEHNFDIILGINFLAAHRIGIDFHRRELVFSQHFSVPFNL